MKLLVQIRDRIFGGQKKKVSPFPIVWLTYLARVRADVKDAYAREGGREFFSEKFEESLAASAKDLEGWQIRLNVFQATLYSFVIVGIFSHASSASVFGLSMTDVPGLRELAIFLISTVSLASYVITTSKDLRIGILETLQELKFDPAFKDFALLATPASFHMRVYITKRFQKWIFPLAPGRVLFGALLVMFISAALLLFFASVWMQIYLLHLIYTKPSLGWASRAIFWYVILVSAIGILWLIRFFVPLPFRDQQTLQDVAKLKEINPAEYSRQMTELFAEKK